MFPRSSIIQDISTVAEVETVVGLVELSTEVEGREIIRNIVQNFLKDFISSKFNISSIEIKHDIAGRPLVRNCPELSVSFSYSGKFGVFALSKKYIVGIDLQKVFDFPEFEDVCSWALTTQEIEYLLEESGRFAQLNRFYQCWVRKESLSKLAGCGFISPLNKIETQRKLPGVYNETWRIGPDYLLDLSIGKKFCEL